MSFDAFNPLSDDFDPRLVAAIESVTVALAGAFDEIWTRPDAAQTMAGFMDGDVHFVMSRAGVSIVRTVAPEVPDFVPPELDDGDGDDSDGEEAA